MYIIADNALSKEGGEPILFQRLVVSEGTLDDALVVFYAEFKMQEYIRSGAYKPQQKPVHQYIAQRTPPPKPVLHLKPKNEKKRGNLRLVTDT